MYKKPLSDQEARDTIRTELTSNFIVEAAAGTGKTTSLVSRMVALIATGTCPVSEIAAVTFTRKAAAQLRERFQEGLEKALSKSLGEEPDKRLRAALSELHLGFIGTIHSFCARLLRERPVEAGVDPAFEELEEDEDRRLRDEFWTEYAERLFLSQVPLLKTIGKLGVKLSDLRPVFNRMTEYADVEPAVDEQTPEPDFSAELSEVEAFLEKASRLIPSETPPEGRDELQKRLRTALLRRNHLSLQKRPDIVRLFQAFDYRPRLTQKTWPDKEAAKQLAQEFENLRESVVLPALIRWREYLHPVLLAAVLPALDQLSEHRRKRATMNFQDLLMLSRDMLRDHPEVRAYFKRRYSRILVDEFQDTDPIQAEVLLYLTGEDVSEVDWRRLKPVPGSLFLVGDPKQSIYRFRRADIATNSRVKELIIGSAGRVLALTTNFRSLPGICEWVNSVFQTQFPHGADQFQAANEDLNADRASGDDNCGVFRLTVPYDKKKQTVAQADAQKVALWISSALQNGLVLGDEGTEGECRRPVRPSDFLVVLRTRDRLHLYARALERYGIPFSISGGKAFAQSEELSLLLRFMRALVDADDPVSLVAFLRSEICGVDDNALYHFRRSGGRFHYLSPISDDADERIRRGFALLQEVRGWTQELPPAAVVSRCCHRLGLIAHSAAQELGGTRSGNLLKALVLCRSLSGKGNSLMALLEQLDTVLAESDIEEMNADTGQQDAVRIMNLHRAKGLEARVVFLADPSPPPDFPPAFHVDRESEPPKGYFSITRKDGHQTREIARPRNWEHYQDVESRFEEAEKLRLLYVAATRAKDVLVISQSLTKNGACTGAWQTFAPFLKREVELPDPSESVTPVGDEAGSEVSAGLDAFRVRASLLRETASRPSFRRESVTGNVGHGSSFPSGSGGRGLDWGRVVHRALEALMRDSDIDMASLADASLRAERCPTEDIPDLVALLRNVQSCTLWQRAGKAKQFLTEVPFAVNTAELPLGAAQAGDVILNGVVDLAFEEESGWVIVDYKTDSEDQPGRGLFDQYQRQVLQYAAVWERITGQPTAAFLLFVSPSETKTVHCGSVTAGG